MNILRKISFALTEAIFTVIPSVYDIFERIGSHEFFTSETIQYISNNIYILVSVCMLFAFGIKLINTIVNPDLVDDKKKGTGKTFINGIIAVVLISTIPFIFQLLYKTQNKVIEDKLIQQIVFGTDGDYKPGDLLAGYAFGAFCYPSEEVSNKNISSSGKNYYNKVVKGEINYIHQVGDAINDEINGEYELHYHIILSPLSGGYLLYQLILMCIDVAFRSVKLGLLQLMAPLVICAFIFSGTELLSRWVKEVISTYILLFAKVAAITFMVYAMSLLPDLFERMSLIDDSRDTWAAKGFIRVAFIIGLLQLVNKLPEIINSIFGTKLDTKDSGISGRLAAMAGVGGVASKAWDTFKRHPLQTAAKPAGVVLGVGGNIANRMGTTAANLRQKAIKNGFGKGSGVKGGLVQTGAIVGGLIAGAASGVGSSIGAGRRGWNNGIAAAGREAAYYRDTHQPGSNVWQRTVAGAARTLGFRTPYERQSRNDDMIQFGTDNQQYQKYNGLTVDQLKNIQSQNQDVVNVRNTIKDAATHAVEDQYSNVSLTGGGAADERMMSLVDKRADLEKELTAAQASGNAKKVTELGAQINDLTGRINAYTTLNDFAKGEEFSHFSLTQQLKDYSNANLQQRQATYDAKGKVLVPGETDEEYADRVAEHGRRVSAISHALNIVHDDMRDGIIDISAMKANTKDEKEERDNAYKAFNVSGRDQSIMNTNMVTAHNMHRTLNDGTDFSTFDEFNSFYGKSQGEFNDASSALTAHQQSIYNRQNTTRSRARQASQASVDARRNRGGGGNSGGGNH